MTLKKSMEIEASSNGAQAVDRALQLLKLVGRFGAEGARLSDITTQSGLSRPTVHRLLQSLISAGFVRQQEARRYELGPALFELGLAAPSPIERLPKLRPVVEDLARESGDTAFLAIRRGDEMLYVVRAEGSFPVRVHIIREGDRLPLPVSAAGICIMAAMSDREIDAIFERRTSGEDDQFPWASESVIRELIEQVRARDYLLGENTVASGVTGLGIAIPSTFGAPLMGLSISAISSRVPPSRVPKLAAMLKASADRIAELLK